jgi:hypothetical protein
MPSGNGKVSRGSEEGCKEGVGVMVGDGPDDPVLRPEPSAEVPVDEVGELPEQPLARRASRSRALQAALAGIASGILAAHLNPTPIVILPGSIPIDTP